MNIHIAKNLHIKLLVILFLLLAQCRTASADGTVILATHDVYPHHYIERGEIKGRVIRQLQCAFNRMETPYRAEFGGWVDDELSLRTGKIDGIFAVSMNDTRKDYGELSTPLATKHLYWYFSGTKLDVTQDNPLYQRYRVAAEFGSDEWFIIKRQKYNVRMKPKNAQSLVKMLINHEVDAILIDERVFEYQKNRANVGNLSFTRTPYQTIDLGVLFSTAFLQKNPRFLASFNLAVSNCLITTLNN
ncbi:transporter substrate-binding domain-containing protein [Thalassotalea euphylliae]|uniref:transporter substrate-binding domain-containing protein n=1 Tax=Thalassotalea euphylliae TaxID=1655234 RepID=UPI002162F2F8|nr:transporter substrate-binding domain-containing protein [Thalassotalea euphylliae]